MKMTYRTGTITNVSALVLLILAAILVPAGNGYPADASTAEIALPSPSYLANDEPQEHPVMRLTEAEREQRFGRFLGAVSATMDSLIVRKLSERTQGTSVNNLANIQYTPGQRNQGSAGNCWVWGCTAAVEAELFNQLRITGNRLSIQYLDSNYNNGTPGNWAGCGGSPYGFANFYNSKKIFVPWTNTNASYQDAGRTCSTGTSVPASSLATNPAYAISSITTTKVSTYMAGEAAAIANIKNVLNQGKVPVFCFYLADSTDWNQFFSFWNYQSEDTLWPNNFSCGKTYSSSSGGGHAVACVGYNDDDPNPANQYWIMINSWGTRPLRPNGLFRVPMHYNYNCATSQGWANTEWWTVNVSFNSLPQHNASLAFFNSGTWYIDTNHNGNWDAGADGQHGPLGMTAGDIPLAIDWDGDGRQELCIYRPSAGAWFIDINHNGVFDPGSDIQLGPFGTTPGDIPVAIDWDGDGRQEAAIFRTQGTNKGMWYIDSNHSGRFESGSDLQLGPFGMTAGDIPVAIDRDGDGRQEAAIFRTADGPNKGMWYIDTNHSGRFEAGSDLQLGPFGTAAGDVPVAVDWNDDGRQEACIFHQGGSWSIDTNQNGVFDSGIDVEFSSFGSSAGSKPLSIRKW